MFNFVITFVAALFALFAFNFITTHVEKVEGFNMVAQCSINDCYEINNTVFVIK